jgi:hypothetical protein
MLKRSMSGGFAGAENPCRMPPNDDAVRRRQGLVLAVTEELKAL